MTCNEENCDKVKSPAVKFVRGYCPTHYARHKRAGDFGGPSCDECDRVAVARGKCYAHYRRLQYAGLEGKPECSHPGCTNTSSVKGYCGAHYAQHWSTGSVSDLRLTGEWSDWEENAHGYLRRRRTVDGSREQQLQHRFVMEDHLGRDLLGSEEVHHKNGNRQDNRLSNLELWNTRQPKGQRPEDKVEYAIEILRLYAPEKLNTLLV